MTDMKYMGPLAVIKAHCEVCGTVELMSDQVVLRLSNVWAPQYIFECPGCGVAVENEASEELADMLEKVGATVQRHDVPEEALEPHDGPPIDHDDLLDFLIALESME